MEPLTQVANDLNEVEVELRELSGYLKTISAKIVTDDLTEIQRAIRIGLPRSSGTIEV